MPPDLSFGPVGDEWHYDRTSRTYDITRGTGSGFRFETTGGPPDTSIALSPELSALVVVDMQNFFLHPSCRAHPTGLAAVDATQKVISKCRELGVQVIWLNWGLTDDELAQMPAAIQRSFSRSMIDPGEKEVRPGLGSDLGDGKGRCLMAGEWNSEIYGPLADMVVPEDLHCAKNRMSGMWTAEQPLWKHLTASGKRTLLFAGVNTDQCVYGTLVDAYSSGWDCIMLEDCCGTKTAGAQEVCKLNMIVGADAEPQACYGFVTDSKSFVSGEIT